MIFSDLETLRKRPRTKLYLSIYEPQVVFRARINDASIGKGAREITYDTVSFGSYLSIKSGATMWIGTTSGAGDVGKIRVRSATSSVITVSENSNIDWANNRFLTVFYYFELWPVFPRIIENPSNEADSIFYKDYDIPYTNQNDILGTFVNIGPHRAANLESGQAQLYYSSTGTYNLLGHSLSYDWHFQGATVTGSSSAVPGYRTYDTPGNYVTRLTVTDNSNGAQDTTYRYVRIHDPSDPSIQKWQLLSLSGSRDEGGYTASFRVFEDIPIQEHAVVVLYGDNWYGDTEQDIGGNYPNSGNIFWVGYVERDSIEYDYQHSQVSFGAKSIAGIMKDSSGFSVSVESKRNPAKWYELIDMDCRRAIYHYFRWHTTVLNISDFQFVGDDYKIQFFDADRESMFDAIDNFMRQTLVGRVTTDRQGKLWAEVDAAAYETPTTSFPTIMDITRRDWLNEPAIEERLSPELSFIEMGGIAYSGVITGTFAALLASAPGNAPGFRGTIETHEGLAVLGQSQLNHLVGNYFANRNSPFPTIDMEMAINASNLDIAPQETVGVNILSADTVRGIEIDGAYIPGGFTWKYSSKDQILLPKITFSELVDGDVGETVVVQVPTEVGGGFNVPPIQIPPLPPLTIPAYSIPTGTIGAIVTSEVLAFQADYARVYYNNPSTSSSSRGIIISATTINKDASNVQFSLSHIGSLYQVNFDIVLSFVNGTPGGLLRGTVTIPSVLGYTKAIAGTLDSSGDGYLEGGVSFSAPANVGTLQVIWTLTDTGGTASGDYDLVTLDFSTARLSA